MENKCYCEITSADEMLRLEDVSKDITAAFEEVDKQLKKLRLYIQLNSDSSKNISVATKRWKTITDDINKIEDQIINRLVEDNLAVTNEEILEKLGTMNPPEEPEVPETPPETPEEGKEDENIELRHI